VNARGTYRKVLGETTGHRRPRERGDPYGADSRFGKGADDFLDKWIQGLWVPAFAGTTAVIVAPTCPHPLAAPTLENRLRMRIDRVSQTSR
jgi:hypothetical protein